MTEELSKLLENLTDEEKRFLIAFIKILENLTDEEKRFLIAFIKMFFNI